MKNGAKTFIKATVGTSAAVFAAGALAYEGALNIKLAGKICNAFKLDDERMMDIFKNHPVFKDSIKWFAKMAPLEEIIRDENGDDVHAYVIKQSENSDKWAVCVHGYRGSPAAQAPFAKHFYDMGYNVILPHLRAHENDTHKYSSMGYYEKDMVMTWIKYIAQEYPKSKIVIHGVSMGSATTMMVTGEKLPENVKCAIADCGYTSCWDEYTHVLGENHIPAFPLLYAANAVSKLRGNFDFKKCSPIEAVSHSVTPTLFIHGEGDDFVPYSMLDKVYDSCTAEKAKLSVPGAYHATSVAFDTETYFNTMDAFVKKYL